ncbi:MAG: hypothetical protein HY908_15365 [Myxococcales bacterium]|nr:hypothetical protein [Myxococcales bacterium]
MTSEPIPTRVARTGWGEHGFMGHRLFADLAGVEHASGLLAIALTGRRLAADDQAVLDDVAVACTLADPRIWPAKVARIVSGYGRALPGFAAGYLCLEGALIGPWMAGAAAAWLARLAARPELAADDEALARALDEEIRERRTLAGFGVPFRPADERVAALDRLLAARGRATARHWSFFARARRLLTARRRLEANISCAIAAAGLDLGFAVEEVAALAGALAQYTFFSNAFEAAREPAPALQTLDPAYVVYVGPAERTSPRAAAARPTRSRP